MSLVGFEQASLANGQTASVRLDLEREALVLVDAAGDRVLYEGEHTLVFNNGVGATCNVTVVV
jgi:hypothetical protein